MMLEIFRSRKQEKRRVFVSYSRKHAQKVDSICAYLMPMADVWIDRRSIEYGDGWREAIARGISEAEIIYIFWCGHAAQSEVIREEIHQSLASGCKIIPVRFSELPPLPDGLHQLNAINETAVCAHDEPVRDISIQPARTTVALLPAVIAVFYYIGNPLGVIPLLLGLAGAGGVIYVAAILQHSYFRNQRNKLIARKMKEMMDQVALAQA